MTDNELRAHDIAITLLMSEYQKATQQIDKPDIVQVYKSIYDAVLQGINHEFGKK